MRNAISARNVRLTRACVDVGIGIDSITDSSSRAGLTAAASEAQQSRHFDTAIMARWAGRRVGIHEVAHPMWRSLSAILHGRPAVLADAQAHEPPSIEPAATPPPPSVAPDVVGLTSNEARRLGRSGGQCVFIVERTASRGLWGRVLEQEPAAGSPLASDGMLVLTVGAKPHVTVPDVRGRAEDDALSLLRQAGLGTARRAIRRSDRMPEGHVVRTRPRPGAEVPVVSLVSYVVAAGPGPDHGARRRIQRRARAARLPDGSFLRDA